MLAVPFFLVTAASPYLRHKQMWVNMFLQINTPLPQILVLVIFLPRASGGAGHKKQPTPDPQIPTSKVAVTVSVNNTSTAISIATEGGDSLGVADSGPN